MLTAPSWSPENIKVKELQTQLLAVRTSVICAMNQLLDLKDLNTGVHSTRLAEWAVRIGRDLGLDDDCLRDLEAAAILHDIGKIGVPDAILRKPSKLTEEEYAVIKKHPEYGWAVLRAVPASSASASSCCTITKRSMAKGIRPACAAMRFRSARASSR
jgi:HD-GYP domain-containing protein (c-di-GMP phosphodiesterase class II)